MVEPAIRVTGLWKEYRLGSRRPAGETFYDVLSRALRFAIGRRPGPFASHGADTFWALRDLTLELAPGDVLGVIGRNGAGKSTLLKILSRITVPTRGRVEIRGRVASLLEVGTGFHPELSGRENIFLNGAILGMSSQEIHRKFDEIVAFAEIEKFLDTPVKRYSSGMYVRLAFAVAAHLEPDVLLVDEVLSVGDAEFQQRCLGKMEQAASAGRTVVFVSHNIATVRHLCTRGLLLHEGSASRLGDIASVSAAYLNANNSSIPETHLPPKIASAQPWRVARVAARRHDGRLGEPLTTSCATVIEVDVESQERANIDVFIHCYDSNHSLAFSSSSLFDGSSETGLLSAGTHRFTCELPANLLNDGSYTLDALLVRNRQEVLSSELSVLTFRLEDDFAPIPGWQWRPAGVIRPKLRWRHEPSPFKSSVAQQPGSGGHELDSSEVQS